MSMFKGMIAALGLALAATTMTSAATAGDRQDRHDARRPMYGHGPDRGHGWNNGRHDGWRNHHRHCRTEWRHHRRVTRCR